MSACLFATEQFKHFGSFLTDDITQKSSSAQWRVSFVYTGDSTAEEQ